MVRVGDAGRIPAGEEANLLNVGLILWVSRLQVGCGFETRIPLPPPTGSKNFKRCLGISEVFTIIVQSFWVDNCNVINYIAHMPYKPTKCQCENCHTIFLSKNGRKTQRFCSIQCGGIGRFKPAYVPKRKTGNFNQCLICKKMFYVRRAIIKKGYGKYCSHKCARFAMRRKKRICNYCKRIFQPKSPYVIFCSVPCERKHRRRGLIVKCRICQKSIYRDRTRISKGKLFFCSTIHLNQWQGRNKIERTCIICGNKFKWSASRLKQTSAKYCSIKCRNNDPVTYNRLIEMNAKQQRGNPTKIELIGYKILDLLKIKYFRQYVIGGKFCVDAFIPSKKVIVQFDGDYWHGNPEKFKELDNRQKRRKKLDYSQDCYMKTCGYSVIRLWETDLLKNFVHVKSKLQEFLIR